MEIKTIDEYILACPVEIQEMLKKLRKTIKEAAPEAQEKISWGMATFALHGNLIHFAAHKSHIGLYPGASGVEVFKNELSEFKTSKGAIQFPINKPIPYELVKKIVKYRVKENTVEFENKKKQK
jgi:uncharacterized protein YdhG (YjbR/CyaY superfamily)